MNTFSDIENKSLITVLIHSVGGNFSISDLLQPQAEVKNAEQHGRPRFNSPAQFIKMISLNNWKLVNLRC